MLVRKSSFLDAKTVPVCRDADWRALALSPCIEYEQRLGSTEWYGIERALPTRATVPTGKANTTANKEDLSLALPSNQ